MARVPRASRTTTARTPAPAPAPSGQPVVIGLDVASKSDIVGMVWMRMTVGMSGPHFSLSPGDCRLFDADEAERLRLANFAEPAEAPAA